MLNEKVLEYMDDVMSRIVAPEEFKDSLENELIRHIIETSGDASIGEITNTFGSPAKLADEISGKLVSGMSKELDSIFKKSDQQNVKLMKMPETNYEEYAPLQNYDRHRPKRPIGEYTRTESDINIKLLYIPLIQISTGVQTLHYILTDDECDHNWPRFF